MSATPIVERSAQEIETQLRTAWGVRPNCSLTVDLAVGHRQYRVNITGPENELYIAEFDIDEDAASVAVAAERFAGVWHRFTR